MTSTRVHMQIYDVHMNSTHKNLICAYDYRNNTLNDGVGLVMFGCKRRGVKFYALQIVGVTWGG